MAQQAKTAVVILNYNSAEHTLRCVAALRARSEVMPEVLVVDNASAPVDREKLAPLTREGIRLVQSGRNLGFSGGMMLGARQLDADYCLLLNNDCEFQNDVLAVLQGFMQAHPEAALCSAAMLDESGKPRSSFNYFPSLGHALFGYGLSRLLNPRRYPDRRAEHNEPLQVDVVSGAAMFLRSSVFQELGGLDTGYFLYCEEEDYALRLHRAGWQTWLVPAAKIIHVGGASSQGAELKPRLQQEFYISFCRYLRLHYGPLYGMAFRLVTALKLLKRALTGRAPFALVGFVLKGAPEAASLRHQA
ncbi:MAG TPA: glycosyltransferase family 2 protein [Gammaproteobacteria bacterium]|nr:glycosyltransferase family 2 protein [Gammaproteobacteria bacterium]